MSDIEVDICFIRLYNDIVGRHLVGQGQCLAERFDFFGATWHFAMYNIHCGNISNGKGRAESFWNACA